MKRKILTAAVAVMSLLLISCNNKSHTAGNENLTVAPTQAAGTGLPGDITQGPDHSGQAAGASAGNSQAADDQNSSGTENQGNLPYSVAEASYFSDDIIKIYYPQITGLKDKEIQDRINQDIKASVLKYKEGFDTTTANAALEIDYVITWKGERLLSLRFTGYRNTPGAAYPVSFTDTLNFDLQTGEEVKLSDMVKTDEGFLKLLKEKGETKYYYFKDRVLTNDESFSSADTSATIKNYVFDGGLLADAGKADTAGNTSVSSYFTEDSLGISVETIHAYGDHIEFEIKYKDILDYLKTGNALWGDFPDLMKEASAAALAAPTPTPVPAKQEQEPEINEDEINKNTNYVPGFYIVRDQSFWTEFENWGKVFFITAGGEGEFGLNSLYLYLADKDGKILYEFPYFYGNGMQLGDIEAVAFQDVNRDGLKDVIVIADYMTGIGPTGAEEFPVAGVYFQKGKEFINLPELDGAINSSGENTSVDSVAEYLKGMDISLD